MLTTRAVQVWLAMVGTLRIVCGAKVLSLSLSFSLSLSLSLSLSPPLSLWLSPSPPRPPSAFNLSQFSCYCVCCERECQPFHSDAKHIILPTTVAVAP